MSTSETLKTALRVIEDRGWIQNDSQNGDGVCAVGAIGVACGYDGLMNRSSIPITLEDYMIASSAINELASELMADGSVGVASWNDTPGRTKEEVVWLYRHAIATAEHRELALRVAVKYLTDLFEKKAAPDPIDVEFNALFKQETVGVPVEA